MPKKKVIVVTGGAGFVGTNLIKLFLNKTKYRIISIDDYSSGKKTNHIQNSRIKMKESGTNFYFWYYLLPMTQHHEPKDT